MNWFQWTILIAAVIFIGLIIFSVWRTSRRTPADRAADAEISGTLKSNSGLGPHASAQDATWQNKATHGNMG